MVQKVSGDMLEDGAIGENPTGFTVGNYMRVGADGTLEQRTPTQVQGDIGAAPSTGAALTKTDDTNVTATLTGNPTNGLLRAINIALGWTGLLGVARGGTGIGSYTAGNYLNASGATTLQQRTPAQVRTDIAVDTSSSGTYTPTVTNIANVASSTPNVAQWMRVGNVITVSGNLTVTPTATGDTQFRLSLPVASNFSGTTQCSGSGGDRTAPYAVLVIYADTTNKQAWLNFTASTTAARAIQYHYTYLVI